MGEVLVDLFESLRVKQNEWTPLETNVLQASKSKAVRQFTAGALLGGGLTWAATWKLSKLHRIYLSGGAAVIYGLRRFGGSLNSSVDDILALDGTRMQLELANIIVNKYQDDPWRMQVLSKHFYTEKVYDDSTSEQPKLRWRYRNYFSDNVVHGQRTPENDYDSDSHKDSPDYSHNATHNDSDSKKTDLQSKRVPVNAGVDVMADPLDDVFGCLAMTEEIHHPSTSSMPTKVLTRSHKRSHRRRRLRDQEVPLEPQHT